MNGIPLGKNKWFIKQYSPSDFFGTKFGGGGGDLNVRKRGFNKWPRYSRTLQFLLNSLHQNRFISFNGRQI